MSKLSELRDLERTVVINGVKVQVPGVSAEGIAILIDRFAGDFAKLQGASDLSAATILKSVGPEALAGILAAGVGEPGDEAAEQAARRFNATVQLDLLSTILDVTMPGGIDPFVKRVEEVVELLGPEFREKIAEAVSQGMAPTSSPEQSTSS